MNFTQKRYRKTTACFEPTLQTGQALLHAAFRMVQVETWRFGHLVASWSGSSGCRQTDKRQKSYHCGNLYSSHAAKPDGTELL